LREQQNQTRELLMKEFLRSIKRGVENIIIQTNQIYYGFAKSEVECNICHYKTNRFTSNYWHSYTGCFKCKSDIRHRLIWATLEHLKDFSLQKIIQGKSVLHFAPEKTISVLLKQNTKNYKTADYFAEGYYFDEIDYNIDISNMPSIADNSFDCVIACDVLEHVPNHLGGLKEMYRILKKDGCCIITIPQKDNLEVTFEDKKIITPADRKKAYGQSDHLRIYGNDFSSMLENCGFKVTVIDETFFTKEIVRRNVLFPPVLSKAENATNYRKVFIGVK
jgi:SAM-dependent methyltransferase